MELDQIRSIITNNKFNIAFIIGNGLHRYFAGTDAVSWQDLLNELWEKTSCGELPSKMDGLSNTEFFDLIEIKKQNRENGRSVYDLVHGAQAIPQCGIDVEKLSEKVSELAQNKNTHNIPFEIKNHSQLHDKIDDILIKFGIDIHNTSSIEKSSILVELLQFMSNNNKDIFYQQTKKSIAEKMKKWEPSDRLKNMVKQIKSFDAPILTTNYDAVLSKSLNLELHKMSDKGFTDFYPWEVYYGEKLSTPLHGFGIWHINGLIKYHRSIKLGLCDYMACVEKARKLIQHDRPWLPESFYGKNQDNWAGMKTWLHIIFNKSLFIFGLGLGEDEVFLRWLLIQRKRYFDLTNSKHKGWYVAKAGETSSGKKFFLETLGFEIVEIEDYKIIYEDVWDSMKLST